MASGFVKTELSTCNEHLFGKEMFIRFTASAFRKLLSIYVFSYFPFGFEGRMWDLIVSVPDHCLSFYFVGMVAPRSQIYKSVLLLVFGLILWKWMNGMYSLGSIQECGIGYKHSHNRVSQCLASIRKLGNRRSSEELRSFKPSKGTNLFIHIILAGDIEKKKKKKRFHASCSNLGDDELLRIESGDGAWYCTNCKADCGLCSGAVLKGHKAVQCDSCDMWIHNECSFTADTH